MTVKTQQSYAQWATLVSLLVKRDLKIRYRNSVLGYAWSMMNPLLMMTVLSIVFSHAMRVDVPHYPLFILSGLLCWNLFSQSASNGVNGIVANASLLKKVKVPSWVFPTATIGSACIHVCLALIPYFIIALVLGLSFGWQVVQLPFVFLVYFLFIEGVVLVLGSLNVFFRDVAHVLEPVLQLVFYASPILYPIGVVPEKYHIFIRLNPIYHFVKAFRASLYDFATISLGEWGVMIGAAALSFLVGLVVYRSSEDRFLYHI